MSRNLKSGAASKAGVERVLLAVSTVSTTMTMHTCRDQLDLEDSASLIHLHLVERVEAEAEVVEAVLLNALTANRKATCLESALTRINSSRDGHLEWVEDVETEMMEEITQEDLRTSMARTTSNKTSHGTMHLTRVVTTLPSMKHLLGETA